MKLLWVMTRLSLLAGRRATRPIVHLIALYFVLAAPAARRASRDYLTRCLGQPARWLDLYRHVLTFASTIHDRIYLLNDRFDLFDVQRHGDLPPLDASPDTTTGAFLFGGHLGSFEVLRTFARRDAQGLVAVAMYPENARQINQALAAINPRAVHDIIALGQLDSILNIHERIERGAMVGILADRGMQAERMVSLPFLGQMASFPSGPFKLAVAMRKPVYFMAGVYRGSGRYELHFERLSDGAHPGRDREQAVRALMQKYARALEAQCRQAPYNWFNFYDFWEPAPHDPV